MHTRFDIDVPGDVVVRLLRGKRIVTNNEHIGYASGKNMLVAQ